MKTTSKNINSVCIASQDEDDAIFRIYENRIFHATIKKSKKASMEVVKAGIDFLIQNGGGKFYNIYEFESFSDVDPDVRSWIATDSDHQFTFVDAIVISSFSQKIMADFYLKINKPKMPTKLFLNLESASKWIFEQIDKRED